MAEKRKPEGIGLSELIYRVKQDLLSDEFRKNDPIPLFAIERLELEISFTVTRQGETGINIQVISLGGGAAREDAQTVRVSLAPLKDPKDLATEWEQQDPELRRQMEEMARRATLKQMIDDEEEED